MVPQAECKVKVDHVEGPQHMFMFFFHHGNMIFARCTWTIIGFLTNHIICISWVKGPQAPMWSNPRGGVWCNKEFCSISMWHIFEESILNGVIITPVIKSIWCYFNIFIILYDDFTFFWHIEMHSLIWFDSILFDLIILYFKVVDVIPLQGFKIYNHKKSP